MDTDSFNRSNAHVIVDDDMNYLKLRGLKGKYKTTSQPDTSGKLLPLQHLLDKSNGKQNGSGEADLHVSISRSRIFCFSAHEKEAAISNARSYAEHLSLRNAKDEERFLGNLAYTLGERRSRHDWSCLIVTNKKSQLVDRLNEGVKPVKRLSEVPRLGFVFSGQGAQWWGMSRELLSYPVFLEVLQAAEDILTKFGCTWSLIGKLTPTFLDSLLNRF